MNIKVKAALQGTFWVLLALALATLLVLMVLTSGLERNCSNRCERAGYPAGGRFARTQVFPPDGTCGCLRVETPVWL